MQQMTGHEVRRAFVSYFKKHGHEYVPSSRLIPENDDTLLFANAGMNQFKNVFVGLEKRPYNRAVSVQKCVRAGGKHNDLENVGFTARHHTFFEMLGNFSFGDYFKKDAIHFGWEFLTKDLQMPKEKLHVTVFRDDDEAAEIWMKQESLPREKISRFDEKDNFWMMGDTGPCGPCSEIFYDHGPAAGCGKPDCKVGCPCDRFVEIWNLVFMQYNQNADGTRVKLPKPSVDTGSGLERVTAVMQGTPNNFETDLFFPLIELAQQKTTSGRKYDDTEKLAACRVLADHARTTAFLIADGALPSNEGRGYVLRRIMRRAIRYGRKLNIDHSLLSPVVKKVIESMGITYPELITQSQLIESTVANEEARFLETLDQGTLILGDEIKQLKSKGKKSVGGETLFKLYDTFGFPVDLSRVIATEQGLEVDEAGFESLMEKARETSKASWKGQGVSANDAHVIQFAQGASKTKFTGYDETQSSAQILKLSDGQRVVDALKAGQSGLLIADRTPFYAEGGGQVGDRGSIKIDGGEAKVGDCTKIDETYIHHITITKGELKTKTKIELFVDDSSRRATQRNHSATHLMHAALRKVLGTHVTQAGSLVDANRLRFDFTHPKALTADEIRQVEKLVNHEISLARSVHQEEMDYKSAVGSGAMALFGEKYGDKVRVIRMGEFSTELCGGTHVHNTSEIRLFKIASEGGVSAGVRRIEALTSDTAFEYLDKNSESNLSIIRLSGGSTDWKKLLEGGASATLGFVSSLQQEIKNKEKELKSQKKQSVDVDSLMKKAKAFSGGKYLIESLDLEDKDLLRQLSDQLRDKLQPAVVVLVGKGADALPILVSVSKDLSQKYNAGKILQAIAEEMGGRGGGRPDFAQGGGKDAGKLDAALKKAEQILVG